MTPIDRVQRALSGREIVRTMLSSAVVVAARVGGTAATFGYTLLMARTMSPADVGVVWTIWSASFVIATFITLNVGDGAVREVVHARARGEDGLAAGFVAVAQRVLLVMALPVMAAFVAVFALTDPAVFQAHTALVGLAALSLAVMGWSRTNASVAAALHQGARSQVPRTLVRPLLVLSAFVVVAALDWRADVTFAVVVLLVATLLSAAIQYAVLRPHFAVFSTAVPQLGRWRRWVATGIILIPSRLLSENLKNVFVLVAAFGLTAADTARFTVALSLVAFLNFGIAAVEITFNPKISAAIARGERSRRDRFLTASGLFKIGPIVVAAILLTAFAGPILSIFGTAYVEAASVVQWFVLMPLARAAAGPTTLVLQTADRRIDIIVTSTLTLALIGIAVPLAAAAHGLEAAAMAGTLAFVAGQALAWLVCVVRTGTDPSPLALVWRALAAGRPRT